VARKVGKTRSADLGSVGEDEIAMHDQGLLLESGFMVEMVVLDKEICVGF
jgi:hypothetical protein